MLISTFLLKTSLGLVSVIFVSIVLAEIDASTSTSSSELLSVNSDSTTSATSTSPSPSSPDLTAMGSENPRASRTKSSSSLEPPQFLQKNKVIMQQNVIKTIIKFLNYIKEHMKKFPEHKR